MIIKSKIFFQFPEIRCGISTRQGGISPEPFGMNLSFKVGDDEVNVRKNRERFFGSLGIGIDSLATTHQVHGDTVQLVESPGKFETCDALITNTKNIFLAVTVADCLPILLFDPVTHSVAAVHTGWRGSKLKITEKTVGVLSKEYGVSSKNLFAYIGPSADVCCYEVGDEVAQEFPKQFLKQGKNSKLHLNLKEYNRRLLLDAGIKDSNIEVSEHCTISQPELFHSYRRDGKYSGRMMGVIGIAS